MALIIKFILFMALLVVLISGIVYGKDCGTTKDGVYYGCGYGEGENNNNLLIGGIDQNGPNPDDNRGYEDAADVFHAKYIPTYYTHPIRYVSDGLEVDNAAKSKPTDQNGLTRDALKDNTYDTIIGYSGGTTSVVTAMTDQNVKAHTLVLISPMKGWDPNVLGNFDWQAKFTQKIQQILASGTKIVVLQSSDDEPPLGDLYQYKFPENGNQNIEAHNITLTEWGIEKGTQAHKDFFFKYAVNNLKIGGDGTVTVTESPNGKVGSTAVAALSIGTQSAIQPLPQPANGTLLEQLYLGEEFSPISVAFSPDGSKLATSNHSGCFIWDVASGTKLRELKGFPSWGVLAFSPDGSKLAVNEYRGLGSAIRIFDVNSGEELQSIEAGWLLAFRPNGTELVSIDGYNAIHIWNVTRGTNLRTLDTKDTNEISMAISPDSNKLAVGDNKDRTVSIWDTTNGIKLQEILLNHPAAFMAFNFDGSKLAIQCYLEKKIAIWDVASGKKLREFDLADTSGYQLSSLAFSPDGSKLALYYIQTELLAGFIILLDANSGKQLSDLRLNRTSLVAELPNGPFAMAFNFDGSKLATGQYDGYARIWEV